MRYRVRHRNRYQYVHPVSLSHSHATLLPRDTLNQQVLSARLTILPGTDDVHERQDLFGNRVSRFSIEEVHTELNVLAESEVEVRANRVDLNRDLEVTDLSGIPAKTRLYCRPSLYVPIGSPEIQKFADQCFTEGRGLIEGTRTLNEQIFHEFVYDQTFSDVETPVASVLSEKRGVCQDFAHLMLACLRSKGIACRYVSGYLETDPPAGQPKLMGADASHAWVSVFVPGTGWIDFDPTNGLLPSDRHVTLAWGRDYADVVPLKGLMTGGGQHTLEVSVDVTPLE
ncbi:transglutaminase family protein [Litorivicinus sp.]|nr:transglutaminase family protein [Litorivicinus sp.]